MIKFCMKVYGCQMNVYDSDKVKNNLLLKGWNEISPEREEEADLIIITGCSVRAKAEQKVWSELGRYDKFKRRPVLALTGCIAQSLGKRALTRFDWVKLVSGPRHIGLLPDALEKVMNDVNNSKLKINLLDENPREFFDLDEVTIKRDNKYKAYVTIAHGCDNFCTYCIVPYVRGRFLSRKPEDILREIKILVDDGVREVTLLGQNVNSYGKDLGDINFAELLRRVAKIDGLDLIRFVTSLPQDFTREIAEVMASDEKICPSLNLPVQNGSDRILKLMNRKYTRAEYLDKVNMIRSLLPELGLTTDLIVGFPSETEQDFEDSLSILREVKFDMVHSAAYSEREGTPAAVMDGALPQSLRLERLTRLNNLQDGITLSINKALINKNYKILVDGAAPKQNENKTLLQGRTGTDKVVIFDGDKNLIGNFVNVKIVEAESWCLHGELI
ncbi:MAG: tRNA (N6-isopentenyl adenosine(37)-C2)-methylthiotransferase MiaB [Synergistaceae bacterium]|nr:tRNA (N6-isopentenyl adenosine(37)-C2)-methylthiotransferase MiaB [Synergistaceae bacterium]